MELHGELTVLAEKLEDLVARADDDQITVPLNAMEEAIKYIGRSWGGSWLGYHSLVYYQGFSSPPAGTRFSPEWGLMDTFAIEGTIGEWQQYSFEQVKSAIYSYADNPDLTKATKLSEEAAVIFDGCKSDILSVFHIFLNGNSDEFMRSILKELEKISPESKADIINSFRPIHQIMSRDSTAVSQGIWTPPHISLYSDVLLLRLPTKKCKELAILARKASSHIRRVVLGEKGNDSSAENRVFIGHGRSSVWRELKDFIQDRLHLPWDEFDRVPVAGYSVTERLSQMLNESSFAFLIMTAEDGHNNGGVYARMNVVHEAGLFQGRLGFNRAIVLFEDGCGEFSNIHGLVYIAFPRDNIAACFEKVREVLEREGVI